jgi:hypothetical protein
MQTTKLIRALICALFFIPSLISYSVIAQDNKIATATDSSAGSAKKLRPYQAEYKIFRGGNEYGKGKRAFMQVEDDLWYLHTSTEISFLFLSDKRDESSWFQVYPDHVEPVQYRQHREGTGPDKLSLILFDHRLQRLKELGDTDEFKAVYQPDLLDGASYQFQMTRDIEGGIKDVSYPIIMDGKNKDYRFRVVAEEQIETPMGALQTIKLERVRSNQKRQTFVWLAKDYGYVVARIWQSKGGSEQADLQISNFEWLPEQPHPELKEAIKEAVRPAETE